MGGQGGWTNEFITSLTIPSGASSGPRIVIGSDIPPELVAYYSGGPARIDGAILWYYGTGTSASTYHYYGVVDLGGGVPPGSIVRGNVLAGTVFEFDQYIGSQWFTTSDLYIGGGTTPANLLVENGNISIIGATGGNLYATRRALGIPTPATHFSLAWNFDPVSIQTALIPTNGVLYLSKIQVPTDTSVTGLPVNQVRWAHSVAGVGPVAGQNWIGLYNSAGTLLNSVNVDASVTTVGIETAVLPGGAGAATPSDFWVGMLFNAATPPTVYTGPVLVNSSIIDFGTAASAGRWVRQYVGLTALPNPVAMATNAFSNTPWWFALRN